jgi:hypothetical protein
VGAVKHSGLNYFPEGSIMSKMFISKVIAAASLISLSTLSTQVSAEAFVSYKEIPGVVAGVNPVESTITITTKDGVTKTFNVIKGAKVATTKGRAMSLSTLAKGDTVVLKNRVSDPIAGEIKGKILAINEKDMTVKLREHNTKNIVHVKFTDSTGVSAADSVANLRRGNDLVVPLATK